jgi:hypothetical protein
MVEEEEEEKNSIIKIILFTAYYFETPGTSRYFNPCPWP